MNGRVGAVEPVRTAATSAAAPCCCLYSRNEVPAQAGNIRSSVVKSIRLMWIDIKCITLLHRCQPVSCRLCGLQPGLLKGLLNHTGEDQQVAARSLTGCKPQEQLYMVLCRGTPRLLFNKLVRQAEVASPQFGPSDCRQPRRQRGILGYTPAWHHHVTLVASGC